jgi:hypothetical protein
MKFKDVELTPNNHFIALEYYGLILNRTFLVILTNDRLIGLIASGLLSVEGEGFVGKLVTQQMAVQVDLNNPHSYLKSKYLQKYTEEDLHSESILKKYSANFAIYLKDIQEVYHDPKKKWGMGYYPHDGKVYVKYGNNKKREFIILGDQSGKKIANLINLS